MTANTYHTQVQSAPTVQQKMTSFTNLITLEGGSGDYQAGLGWSIQDVAKIFGASDEHMEAAAP